jgi:hypothetical protein
MRGAQDWRRGEDIRLQELQDHHIFPKAFLKRHSVTKPATQNTIANRTLISDETNGRIKDKAPADYLRDTEVFPSGTRLELLEPHFIGQLSLASMLEGAETLSDDELLGTYEDFTRAREDSIIAEIRRVCGVPTPPAGAVDGAEVDQPAQDILAGGSLDDEWLDLDSGEVTST